MDFQQYQMFNRNERILAVPVCEWERRWAGIRQIMRQKRVGAVLVYGNRQMGLGLWLTGYNRQEITVIPLEGKIQEVWRRENGYLNNQAFDRKASGRSAIAGVERVLDPDWSLLRKLLSGHENRLGLVHANAMNKMNCEELARELPDVDCVSLDDEIGFFQSQKSLFELELVKESMKVHDNLHKAVPLILRRGRAMKEVSDDLRYLMLQNGTSADDMCLMLLTHDLDGKNIEISVEAPGRRFTGEDIVEILIETDGPGGYYTAVMRQYALGEPTQDFMKQYEIAKKANLFAGSLMYEGNTLRGIADQVNRYIEKMGYTTDNCCYLHGMGYGMCEMPIMRDGTDPFAGPQNSENLPLISGMISLAHPHVGRKNNKAYSRHEMMRIVQTWEVTQSGGRALSQIPMDIFFL